MFRIKRPKNSRFTRATLERKHRLKKKLETEAKEKLIVKRLKKKADIEEKKNSIRKLFSTVSEPPNNSKIIYLSNKKYSALVDAEDYERLSKYRWHLNKSTSNKKYTVTLYAIRWHVYGIYYDKKGRRQFKKKNIYMHNEVLKRDPEKKLCVDHINFNGLDNRKCNLRIVSRSINSYHKRNHPQFLEVAFKLPKAAIENQSNEIA